MKQFNLYELYLLCGSDKAGHGFAEFYEPRFSAIREKQENTKYLELGLYHGSSVAAFRLFDPESEIFGLDCSTEAVEESSGRVPNGHFSLCDLDNEEEVQKCLAEWNTQFDIILDDASHMWKQQFSNLRLFRPFLKEGGIYILEDLHSSFYPECANLEQEFNVNSSPLAYLTMPPWDGLFPQEMVEFRSEIRKVTVFYYSLEDITAIIQF